ncbi:MAG: hypothetical protein Q7W30_05740 [Coriobacteriia bacterium]|nr:hypothetical protein [Coriobacteriia bacterium]
MPLLIAGAKPRLFTCGTLEASIFHLVAAWEFEGRDVFDAVSDAADAGPLVCEGCSTLVPVERDAALVRLRIEGAGLGASAIVAVHDGRTSIEVRSSGMSAVAGTVPSPDSGEFLALVTAVVRTLESAMPGATAT